MRLYSGVRLLPMKPESTARQASTVAELQKEPPSQRISIEQVGDDRFPVHILYYIEAIYQQFMCPGRSQQQASLIRLPAEVAFRRQKRFLHL